MVVTGGDDGIIRLWHLLGDRPVAVSGGGVWHGAAVAGQRRRPGVACSWQAGSTAATSSCRAQNSCRVHQNAVTPPVGQLGDRLYLRNPILRRPVAWRGWHPNRCRWSPVPWRPYDERGRSLGIILIGAQQTASEVERRIIANSNSTSRVSGDRPGPGR